MLEDPGAVSCAGLDSTAVTNGSNIDPKLYSISFKNLTRLGACPAAPISGQLDLCAALPAFSSP